MQNKSNQNKNHEGPDTIVQFFIKYFYIFDLDQGQSTTIRVDALSIAKEAGNNTKICCPGYTCKKANAP